MVRTLEASSHPERNLLIYDDKGIILGGQQYIPGASGYSG
jgi:hypothetical protein